MVNVLPNQDFIGIGSDLLVVTAGDSTTYGSDLGTDEFRLDNIYGRHIANALTADFLNLGEVGASNAGIAKQIELFASQINNLNYKHIYVICMLTEPGRNFDSHEDQHIDYFTWLKDNIKKSADYYKLLTFLNTDSINRIYAALESHNVTLRIGTHIAELCGVDRVKSDDLLAKTMFEVVAEKKNFDYIEGCYIVFPETTTARLSQVLKLQPALKRADFLRWHMELIEIAIVRRRQLRECGGFNNYHTDEIGHKLWADYILGTIQDV